MFEIKPPQTAPPGDQVRVFLAGSIEMGAAENWQQKAVDRLQAEDVIVFNPRRDNWDPTWVQHKDNAPFREQVEWELDALEKSDYIILYLDPNTKSPISLVEMGLFAHSKKISVVCPDGFWRKGNIDIVAERYGIPQFNSLDELLDKIVENIRRGYSGLN